MQILTYNTQKVWKLMMNMKWFYVILQVPPNIRKITGDYFTNRDNLI